MLSTIRQLKGAIPIAVTSLCLATLSSSVIHGAITASVEPVLENTGTLHFSASIKLKMDGGAPLVIKTDAEKGVFVPNVLLFSKEITNDLAVVVGESSTGSGSNTLDVFLVAVVNNITVVKDRMVMNVPRGDGGLAWSKDGYFLAVRPSAQLENDDLFLQAKSFVVKYGDFKHLKFISLGEERIAANACFGLPASALAHRSAVKILILKSCFALSSK